MQLKIRKMSQYQYKKQQQQSYSQLYMAANIEQDLYRMVQAISFNAHYPCNLRNLNILLQHEFYFDICQIIFPQFNIKLIKIKENQEFNPGQKMQKLIDLLSQELGIDLSSIKGAQIIKSHVSHIHRFLQVLQKFSEYHEDNSRQDSVPRRAKSDPNTSQRIDQKQKAPKSQRYQFNQPKQQHQSEQEIEKKPEIEQSRKKRPKKRGPSYSAAKKQKRSQVQASKNVYNSLVNIMMIEKNRTMKASQRDNRKIKNQQLIEAKNKYKSYLRNYAKQNRATKNREALKKSSTHQKNKELPLQDFQNIQNFFKSFQYRLRDKKYCYLKHVQKLVRDQQVDRMCFLNKLERQQNQQVKKLTKKQIDRIQNEHKLRKTVLKQSFQSQKEGNNLMKKQYERYIRSQKKDLKENKKRQLKKIQDFMDQENGKVLINLEQGGRLERVILDMYKRF